MATIVFQGLQSCVEPQMVETRTLRLKLSSPALEPNTWNNVLSNSPQTPKQIESSYVHPMTQYSKLSIRSLELCTENLGSETGTDMIEDTIFSFTPREENKTREQPKPRHQWLDSRKTNARSFPPPLTSMSGPNSLQVTREGGRLVIQAVEAPSSHGCFLAERSNGRLKLSLFRDFENDETYPENENIEDLENEMNCEKEENVIDEMDEEDVFQVDKVQNEVILDGDMEENIQEVGVEIGIGKFQRPRRCKEGGIRSNKGLCNWESFWVATS